MREGRYNLLMTASTFPRWKGDTEPRFILDLAKSLTPYFNVTVLAPGAPGAEKMEKMEGVNVIRYQYFPISRLQTLCYPGAIVPRIKEKKIRALLVPCLLLALWAKILKIKKNYDIIQANWLIPQGIIQSFFGKPYVVTGHGTDVREMNRGLVGCLKKRCLRKAEAITTVSQHLKKEINCLYYNDKTSIIPMGCWTEFFGKRHAVDNLFSQDGKKVILFVGRLDKIKGITYLIEAVKEIDALLVIVGGGPLESILKAQAAEQGNKIQFLGAKTHEELTKIYASSDIFVAPSITTESGAKEGFGVVILEAMASGLPVVASLSGGIKDIITNGENGILVPERDSHAIADAIRSLLFNEDYYEKICKKSVETAAEFDYHVIGAQYAEIFYTCLSGELATNDE